MSGKEASKKFGISSHLLSWPLTIVCILLLFMAGCKSKVGEAAEVDHYTCPMHPTVISDTQGACPVCGMDLVRKAKAGEELKITEDIARLLQSPDEAVAGSVPTTKGVYRKIDILIKAHGVVTYDTRHTQTIPARVGGRLEEVYLRYDYQPVRKGQKVARNYSPEMLTAQRELLYLYASDPGNVTLIKAARNKLLLLGAHPGQLDACLQTGKPDPDFELYSPADGYVIAPEINMIGSAVTPETEDGMEQTVMPIVKQADETGGPAVLIRKGDYVARGQTLFVVVNEDAMRVEASIHGRNTGLIGAGDPAILDLGAGKIVDARVDFVQPFYEKGEPFVKVRMYARNLNLRIGQLMEAQFVVRWPEAMWLSREAVYELGTSSVVFVKERDLFKPRQVSTGLRQDGWIEVRSGLTSSDEVASQAAFLVDSESFIKSRQTPRESSLASDSRATVQSDALMFNDSQVRLANITTRNARTESIGQTMLLNGRLVADEDRTEAVSSRVGGRVERLFAKETGRRLSEGEPFLELYSETLMALQHEYLLALEHSSSVNDDRFVRSSRLKLLRYGLSEKQVDNLSASRKVQERIAFLAPLSGIVTSVSVKEGQWVEEGTPLYRVEDTRTLWVEAELYPGETDNVAPGRPVTIRISGFEHLSQETRVTFVTPEYRNNSQVVLLRAVVGNREMQYQPGMQAEIMVRHSERKTLAVPIDAVIRGRNAAYLFVMPAPNTFERRLVTLGQEDDDLVEIRSGLKAGEVVVVTGAYLLHSEMTLRGTGNQQ